MVFKNCMTLAVIALIVSACDPSPVSDSSQDHLVGEKVKKTSELSRKDGVQNSKIAFFDETTRLIQMFDLNAAIHERSLRVPNSNANHYLLYHQEGKFVVDLTDKGITIFDRNGIPNYDPIHFEGLPVSTAFRPDLGFLVVYDSKQSVGILKINDSGSVDKGYVLGPLVSEVVAISAGDLLDDGRLALAMSDNSIALVDLDQSLTQQQWVFTSFVSTMAEINWLAPIRGSSNLVLVKSKTDIGILDLSTQVVVAQRSLSGFYVEKIAKLNDPHIILRSLDNENKIEIVYAIGNQLKAKPQFRQGAKLLSSHLDTVNDAWTYVEATYEYPSVFNDFNQVKENRKLNRVRFHDLLALRSRPLASSAQVQLSSDYIFSLFPNKLGYAHRTNINSNEKIELKMFNVKSL